MQARVILIGETDSDLTTIFTESIHEALGDDYHIGILTGGSGEALDQLADDNVVDMFLLHLNNVMFGDGTRTVKDRIAEACKQIRSFKLAYQKPVMAVSSNEDYKAAALEAGADTFVKIPVEPAVLQHEIRTLLAAGDC